MLYLTVVFLYFFELTKHNDEVLILITNPGIPNKGKAWHYYNEYNIEDNGSSGQLSDVGRR
jgi:hypothetical protein